MGRGVTMAAIYQCKLLVSVLVFIVRSVISYYIYVLMSTNTCGLLLCLTLTLPPSPSLPPSLTILTFMCLLLQLGGMCDHVSFAIEEGNFIDSHGRIDKRTICRLMEKCEAEDQGFVMRDVSVS